MVRSKVVVCVITSSCFLTAWLLFRGFQLIQKAYYESSFLGTTEYSWIFRLLLNCIGYATIIVPGFIVFNYLKKTDYFGRASSNKGCIHRALFLCFEEIGERLPDTNKLKLDPEVSTPVKEALDLSTCFLGLMGSYLVWGLLQEKIMTQNYEQNGESIKFKDSQFLVFINRLSAFTLSLARLSLTGQLIHKAPLYKYSFSSFSNVMSAWCQYEALKYISFPTQVLSKACKIIPVMMMGKVVSNNKYEFYEYVTAVMISVGMVFFVFGSSDDYNAASRVSTISGVVLLVCYMLFDSFTSNWQGALFTRYHMSPVQMMCGVNLFSCLLTGISLAQQPASFDSFNLLVTNKMFMVDSLLLSASSALGQLFIFFTISRFGAIVFTIIMTLRQATAILLSCLVYGHSVSVSGWLGVALVFTSVLLRIYCKQRLRKLKNRAHI